MSLLALARPKGTALLLVVPLTGYGFAHWDHELAEPRRPVALALVLVTWVLLSAGSLWLNAALDGDERGALFATEAPRPKHLVALGYGALAFACACALALALAYALALALACALACAALAVLYSHPKTKWKAHALLGPFVNGVGYGTLSWLAGWSVGGVAMSARTAAAMMLMTTFVVGMAFAAQAYQRDDDTRRGYRTLVVTRGPAACLRTATICARVAIGGVAVLAAAGVYPRLVLAGVPVFVLAELTMARWRRAPDGGSPALAVEFVTRMLAGGVVLVALAVAC